MPSLKVGSPGNLHSKEGLTAKTIAQRGDLDEAGLNNTEDDAYGWGLKGQRFAAERRSNRTEQVSFMAAWHQHQLVAPLTEEGDCHRAVFETWL